MTMGRAGAHENLVADQEPAPEAVSEPGGRSPLPLTASLPLLVMLVFPVVVLIQRRRGVGDPDVFWHILGGEHLLQTRLVVFDDPFGHFTTNRWVQLDWLSDLAAALVYRGAGLAGVWWLYSVGIVVVLLVMVRLCREEAGLLAATTVAVVAWIGMAGSLTDRAQVFSFSLLGLTLLAWNRVRGHGQSPWWLVPLTWVWASVHGFWFMGPLVGVLAIAGLLLDRAVAPRQARRLLLVPLGSALAACLTPLGVRVLSAPFTVNSYASLVAEYSPPDIHHPTVAGTMVLVAGTAVGWAIGLARARRGEALMWLAALGLALLYARTVALAAVVVAPLAARQLQGLLHKDPEPPWPAERRLRWVALAGSMVLFAGAGAVVPQEDGKPTRLQPALEALPDATVVLNHDALGGWLLLRFPRLRPVADTRTYLYDIDYLVQYQRVSAAMPGWQSFVTRTGASAALVRSDSPIAAALRDQLSWREVGRDGAFALLQAP